MKNMVLLLAASLMAVLTYGQEMARQSVIYEQRQGQGQTQLPNLGHFLSPTTSSQSPAVAGTQTLIKPQDLRNNHRTSSLCNCRWYDYSALYQYDLDSMRFAGVSSFADTIGFTSMPIWQDTTAIVGYYNGTSIVYNYNPWNSYGMGFDGKCNLWNGSHYFEDSVIVIDDYSPYTIDSVQIIGWYNRDYSTAYKRSVVDTLVVAFVQGNPRGTTSGDLPDYYFTGPLPAYALTGDLDYADMGHDSVNNRAGHTAALDSTAPPLTYTAGAIAGPVYKYLLTQTDTNGSDGLRNTTFPRPGHTDGVMRYPVTAGNMAAVSVSFISGDTGYHAYHATTGLVGDTLRFITGTSVSGYKFGNWEGSIFYNSSDGIDTPQFGPYLRVTCNDWTSGYWKRDGPGNNRDGGWGGHYQPNWLWNSPSFQQYASISFFVKCPTCIEISNYYLQSAEKNAYSSNMINAFPNPAGNSVTVSYTLVQSAPVTVSLTNMLGQVVATRQEASANTGKVVINTSALPDGVYIMNFEGGSIHSTERVVVAH